MAKTVATQIQLTSINNKPFFPVLSGLRALAALLVFFNHIPFSQNDKSTIGAYFCRQLYIGVSLFFVLSGFLITIRYSSQIKETKKWAVAYFKNRMARIYPMYFIVTTITFLFYTYCHNKITPPDYPNTWLVYIANISFLKGFFSKLIFSGVAQGWTLPIEECFYALAPLIFLLPIKIKFRYQIAAFYLLGFILWMIFRHVNFYGFFNDITMIYGRTFFGRCTEFYMGILLAKRYQKKENLPLINKNYTLFGSLSIIAVIVLLIITKGKWEYAIDGTNGVIINNFILPFAIAPFFWGLINEKTWLHKLLSSKLFVFFGKISYTFYLIHIGVISELITTYLTHHYILNLPILIILSAVIFKLIEEPLYLLIKKI